VKQLKEMNFKVVKNVNTAKISKFVERIENWEKAEARTVKCHPRINSA
jgi:phosphoribosylformylglycinamidine (FGAM) synthase PurS component